ncbi:hypothetical protein LTR22_025930 [Elasticomyces elasticus]|nr:hypothetical protein LTR22_025930 [Elasticomyces elasticus]KAK4903566.1 hypothetical protein LTR49_026819 [Elasticomyces elasticus]
MTEEMDGFEGDSEVREAHPVYQENQALREKLTELTKQLAESEAQCVTPVQNMYDPRCSDLAFAVYTMDVIYETEFELNSICDENKSLMRMISLASGLLLDGHAGTANSAKTSQTSLESDAGEPIQWKWIPKP